MEGSDIPQQYWKVSIVNGNLVNSLVNWEQSEVFTELMKGNINGSGTTKEGTFLKVRNRQMIKGVFYYNINNWWSISIVVEYFVFLPFLFFIFCYFYPFYHNYISCVTKYFSKVFSEN